MAEPQTPLSAPVDFIGATVQLKLRAWHTTAWDGAQNPTGAVGFNGLPISSP